MISALSGQGFSVSQWAAVIAAWDFLLIGVASALCAALAHLIVVLPVTPFIKQSAARKEYLLEICTAAFLSAALGVLAWVTGYLTGASRESAVGDLVPAILGAMGAFGGYLGFKHNRAIAVGIVVSCFAICLFVGSAIGASIRERHDTLDARTPPLDIMEREARKEALIKKYREDLGLAWPPQGGETKDLGAALFSHGFSAITLPI